MFVLLPLQQKRIENYQNLVVKDLKDQFIGMNIKQKMRIKMRQTNVDIFPNQILLELIDYLLQFIQINMAILKDLFTKRYNKKLQPHHQWKKLS